MMLPEELSMLAEVALRQVNQFEETETGCKDAQSMDIIDELPGNNTAELDDICCLQKSGEKTDEDTQQMEVENAADSNDENETVSAILTKKQKRPKKVKKRKRMEIDDGDCWQPPKKGKKNKTFVASDKLKKKRPAPSRMRKTPIKSGKFCSGFTKMCSREDESLARNTKSSFAGVFWISEREVWLAERKIDGIYVSGGEFEDELSAAHASDALIRRNCHKHVMQRLNFPDENEKGFFGIYKVGSGKWRAQRKFKGRNHYNGVHTLQTDAARASDEIWRSLSGDEDKLNFPEQREVAEARLRGELEDPIMETINASQFSRGADRGTMSWKQMRKARHYGHENVDAEAAHSLKNLRMKDKRKREKPVKKENIISGELVASPVRCRLSLKNKKSQFSGVFWNAEKNKWMVSRSCNGEHMFGGLYTNEVEAAKRADELVRTYFGPGNSEALNFSYSDDDLPPLSRNSQSRYGVVRMGSKWRAERFYDGKMHYNGVYDSVREACRASDDLWKRLSSAPAKLNYPKIDAGCESCGDVRQIVMQFHFLSQCNDDYVNLGTMWEEQTAENRKLKELVAKLKAARSEGLKTENSQADQETLSWNRKCQELKQELKQKKELIIAMRSKEEAKEKQLSHMKERLREKDELYQLKLKNLELQYELAKARSSQT